MTRSESKRRPSCELGAAPAVADALDPDAVARVVAEAEPEVIVHQLTALSGELDLRHFERTFAADQPAAHRGHGPPAGRRPRGRGAALRGAELRGLAVRAHRRAGEDRGRPARPTTRRRRCAPTLEAILYLESAVTGDRAGTEGVVLRYGGFYGPGTAPRARSRRRDGGGGPQAAVPDRRRRRRASGRFIHIEDAAAATVAAIEHGRRGIYNVVDDEPAPGARSGCRRWRARWAPSRRGACRAGSAGCSAGEAATRHDDRGARRLERQGEARARLAAALPELAAGLRAGARLSGDATTSCSRSSARRRSRSPTGCSAASSEAEDVVQEALLRLHRALEGGERIESPRAYLATVVTRLSIDQLRSARVAARDATSASGCRSRSSTSGDDDPAAPGRAGGLAVARVPRPAREPVARAARRVPAARGVRLPLRRRSPRSSARARTTPASSPRGRAATWRSGGRASRPRASSARSWRTRFFAAAERGRLRRAGGAAGPRRRPPRRRRRQGAGPRARDPRPRPGRAHAAWRGCAAERRSAASPCAAWRSTGSPARCSSTARAG